MIEKAKQQRKRISSEPEQECEQVRLEAKSWRRLTIRSSGLPVSVCAKIAASAAAAA
jgi:hypothetical protein